MRFGAVLVSLSLAVSLVIQPPKAKAFAAVGQLYTVVSAFMASCGLSWGVQGMDETGFGEQVARLLQDYLDTEFAGQTPLEWAGDFTAIATPQGKLQIPKMLVEKLSAFANWTIEKLGIKAGESVVVNTSTGFTAANGHYYGVGYFNSHTDFQLGEPFLMGTSDWFGAHFSGESIKVTNDCELSFLGEFVSSMSGGIYRVNVYKNGESIQHYGNFYSNSKLEHVSFALAGDFITLLFYCSDGSVVGSLPAFGDLYGLPASALGFQVSSVSMYAATAPDVPDASTMADDEALEVGVGAAAGVALDVLLKQILDAILAGNLSATQEIVKAEEGTKPGEITDVDGLGLPALGLALTTRFPFSIPWDVVRGIKLVAAPPEAPYWKVDFMAPISGRVGGWRGDTSIEIDMGKYPLIGQLCRWTSTIGFCLLLASGTKRLIWTA